MKTLGDNLRTAREKSNLNQENAAEELGVTRQSLSNWENNKNNPSVDIIIKMAELYQTDYASLIDNDQLKKKPSTITASRSTYIWCMILGTIIALLIYIQWKNLIFAIAAGAGLPLMLFSSKIFATEFQTLPGHIFYMLFNDNNYVIPYDKLKQIGKIATVTSHSIKIETELTALELTEIINEKLQLQENQFSIIDPTALYFIRR